MNVPDFRLSVVIITLNEAENLPVLLEDLCQQSYRDFEVIVVDSNSEDNTVEIAKGFSDRLDLRTVVMNDRGTSLGRNTGAFHARFERLVFFDADVRIAPDFFAQVVEQLRERKLLISAGRIRSTASWRYRAGVKLFDWGMVATQYLFPTCTGACIFSSKSVHQWIGGFDTRITLCEDCDYVKRASQTFKFRMLPVFFEFNIRRLEKDGIFRLGMTYLKANALRLLRGKELVNGEIDYPFGHYQTPEHDKSAPAQADESSLKSHH